MYPHYIEFGTGSPTKTMPIIPLTTVFDDGGRKAAGFRGKTGDCVVRACSVATGVSYRELYNLFRREARKGYSPYARGTDFSITNYFLTSRGWSWHPLRQEIGCPSPRFNATLPMGTIVVSVPRHMVCVIDHVSHDTFALPPSTPVTGYFSKNG